MVALDILAPTLTFAAGWLLARRRYGPAYFDAMQADLAAMRALVEMSNSPPDPAASEAPVGAPSVPDSSLPDPLGGTAVLPGWDGHPLRSIGTALVLSSVLWAGLIWATEHLI